MNKNIKTGIYITIGLCGFFISSVLSSIVLIFNQSFIAYIVQMILSVFFTILFINILCKHFHHIKLSEIGICNFPKKILWVVTALILPLLIIVTFILFVPGQFKYTNENAIQLLNKIGLGIICIGISTGLTEELWFRGYLMKMIERNNGENISIIISAIIFSLLHMINFEPDYNMFDIILKIINGILVGIMFGLVVYKSKSIWSAVIVHIFWNSITTGIIHIGIKESKISLFNYVLEKDLSIITGGNIGLEMSLSAMIGYIIVIIICIRKNKNNVMRPYCT